MTSLLRASWALVVRDYRVRFRRAIFGIIWFLLPFFSLTGIVLFLGKDLGLYSSRDAPTFFIDLLAGLILWQLFSDCWSEPLRFARRANRLMINVPFDKMALIFAGAINSLVAFALKFPILIIALYWYELDSFFELILLPVAALSLVCVGMGLACFSVPLSLGLLDVRYILPFIQGALLLATPIVYTAPSSGVVHAINSYNPFTYIVIPIRDLISADHIDLGELGAIFLIGSGLFILARSYYRNKIALAIAYIGR